MRIGRKFTDVELAHYEKMREERKNKERCALVVKRFNENTKVSRISEELGITKQRVYQILKREGITKWTSNKGKEFDKLIDSVVGATKRGQGKQIICQKYSIPKDKLDYIVDYYK